MHCRNLRRKKYCRAQYDRGRKHKLLPCSCFHHCKTTPFLSICCACEKIKPQGVFLRVFCITKYCQNPAILTVSMQTIPFIHCEVTAIRCAENNGRYPDLGFFVRFRLPSLSPVAGRSMLPPESFLSHYGSRTVQDLHLSSLLRNAELSSAFHRYSTD